MTICPARCVLRCAGVLVGAALVTAAEVSAQAVDHTTSDIPTAAAMVEILALRTAVPRRTAVREDSLLLQDDNTFVSRDSAASSLAQLPKPTVCGSKPEHGTVRITCQRLVDLQPNDIAVHLLVLYGGRFGSISSGGLLRDVHEHHPSGFDTLRVLCTGRDSLVVPAAAMEVWERDYLTSMAFDTGAAMFNMAGYGDLEYERDGSTKTANRPRGVVSRFAFSASFDDQDRSSISMSGGVGPEYDESERMTRLAGQMQSLTLGPDEEHLRPALAKIARMFMQHWAGHGSMPPAAIEFVNRYGQDNP